MPRVKKQTKKSSSFLSQIKWGESYTSLFLGAVVVVVGLILLFSFLKAGNNSMKKQTGSISTKVEQKILPTTYTVKSGEDLWTISQKIYGTGYNWVDLASANKLANPNILYVGTKLSVPSITPKVVVSPTTKPTPTVVAVNQNITAKTYTVVKGDYLWSIAIRAYGDGYKWVEIAKANKLANPNLIHPGNVFILPR